MGNLHVKNGTPIGSVSLCIKCSYGHVVEGYRESEAIQMCTYDRGMIISFKVKSCSNHYDKNRPTWKQMKQLAIPVDAKKTFKSIGFLVQEVDDVTSGRDDSDSDDE